MSISLLWGALWEALPRWAPWLLGYLLAVNLGAFLTFGIDKGLAKIQGARRIRERTLFLWAGAGGCLGALLGMRFFHHKTLHRSFRVGLPLILAAQLLLLSGAVWLLYYR